MKERGGFYLDKFRVSNEQNLHYKILKTFFDECIDVTELLKK